MEVTSWNLHNGSYLVERTPWKRPHGTYTIEDPSWNVHHGSYFIEHSPRKARHGTYTFAVT